MTPAAPMLVREIVTRVEAGDTDEAALIATPIFASYAGRSAVAFASFH